MAEKPAFLVFVYKGEVFVFPPTPGGGLPDPVDHNSDLYKQVMKRTQEPGKRPLVGLELAVAYETREFGQDDGMEDLP